MLSYLLTGLLVLTAAGASAADSAIRPDYLVLNETLSVADMATQTWPLYLGRQGEYFIEAILERSDDAPVSALQAMVTLIISRGDKVYVEQRIPLTLGPDRPIATLLWFTGDREVPLRSEVDVTLQVEPARPGAVETLRVQFKRKPNRVRPY